MTPEQDFFKLIAEKTEFLKAIAPFLFGGSGLAGVIVLVSNWHQQQLKQKRQHKIPSGDFSFEVIPPHSETVLKQLMLGGDDKDPLADFNIPYLQRQPDRNVRQDIERAFEEKPWVLILGQSGLGKTREAAHLAELLNDEGWTVLNLADQAEKWLDVPRQFPSEISPNAKLLFFVDDLNRWVYEGNPREISKDADDPVQPLRVSVHERLLRVLEFFERECRNQVRVIATARNEQNRHPNRPHEPSEFEKLQFEKYPDFWNRFYRYELAEPSDEAIMQLLSDRVAATNLQAKSEEYSQIARRNDKTFRNIIENLRTAKNRNLVVSVAQLSESLDRTWRLRYKAALKRYPIAQYVYDAVEMLQVLNLKLTPAMVKATAELFVQQRGVKRLWKQLQLQQALRFLISSERILKPRDGQIEAKGCQVDVGLYVPLVLKKLAEVGKTYYSQSLLVSEFFVCGNALSELGRHEDAIISFDGALKCKPQDCQTWCFQGMTLMELKRYEEALASFNKALKHEPNDYYSWFFRGTALRRLRHHEEALASFDEALKHKPHDHNAWHFRSVTLNDLGRYEEALASFDEALKHESDDYYSWHFRGMTLRELKRYEEALASFDEALKHKPDYLIGWHFRGVTLNDLGRREDAIASFDEALKHKPDDHLAWHFRGITLRSLGRYEDAIASFDEALKHKPDYHNAWYNRSCCYAEQSEAELTIANLKQAIHLNPKYRETVKTNSAFDNIRNDDRFQALINAE